MHRCIYFFWCLFLGEISWLALDYLTAQFYYLVRIKETPCIFWLTWEAESIT